MTKKKKNFMKQMATKAIEYCIGDTIYNSIYKAEDWAIAHLIDAIKNASTSSIVITKNDIAYHTKYEILSIVKEKYLMIKDTSKIRSSRILIFRGTPILIIFPEAKGFNRTERIQLSLKPHTSDYGGYGFRIHPSTGDFDGDLNGIYHQVVTPNQFIDTYKKNADAVLTFMTINTKQHKKNLKAFYSIIEKKAEKKEKEINKSKYLNLTGYGDLSATIRKRYMDTVFMNPETKNEISNSIKSFVSRKDWYEENFVPYHYGILLYGPPGTGKSTLIRAIISEYSESVEKQVNIQYLHSIREINEIRQETYELELSPKIIIVEDIDASVLKRRTDAESKNERQLSADGDMPYRRYDEKISLSDVLNTMDGVSNLENVIYIFTTNHIEHLDPALIRPGRIDKLIKVDLPGRDEYDQFMFYHFKKHIPEDFEVKSHKLIAELQNEIVCEKSYDEILETLGKGD
jgi:AAA+ superfamily predicted ATPase